MQKLAETVDLAAFSETHVEPGLAVATSDNETGATGATAAIGDTISDTVSVDFAPVSASATVGDSDTIVSI